MRKTIIALALAMLPMTADACTLRTPFDVTQIGGAELVIIGQVKGFQLLPGAGFGAAIVTVDVEEVLKGRMSGLVSFVWNGALAQAPSADRAQGRVLIGAMQGGRFAVSDRSPDARPDLPSIVQPYCGEVWMQPATDRRVRSAREALQ